MSRVGLVIAIALTVPTLARCQAKPFVDCDPAELARAVPELAAMQPAADQTQLDELLNATGEAMEDMFTDFGDLTAAEEVHEVRFEASGAVLSQREKFRYRARPTLNSAPGLLDEYRVDPATNEIFQPPAQASFLVLTHFLGLMNYLMPDNRESSRFRYLGRQTLAGHDAAVIAFAQLLDASVRQSYIPSTLQGIAWIDPASHRLLRLRIDLLTPAEKLPISSLTTDLVLNTVDFGSATLWLPTRVTVHAQFAGGELHTVHRFSEFRLRGAAEAGRAAPETLGEDAWELRERASNQPPPDKPAPAVLPVPAAGNTIKVEVRQVLVPVIITDKDGHHITSLKQQDFQVFEDGIEQKISSFSVETEGAATAPAQPAAAAGTAPAPAKPAIQDAHRSYLICIDSLHGGFANLVHVREALTKLFQEEQPGDARYALLAVGTSVQVVQDRTADPQDILRAIEDKHFQKVYQGSAQTTQAAEIMQFRRELNDIRMACDTHQPDCLRRSSLPSEAQAIADHERLHTVSFLQNLRSLVRTLSQDPGRRTLILISDGFDLSPGRQAYQLLTTYFPEFRSYRLRTIERLPEMETVLRAANDSNIPIYTIDSRGLHGDEFYSASDPGGTARYLPAIQGVIRDAATANGETLSEISAATGGTAFRNSNDLLAGLQRAFADGRAYYMLAYVPSNSAQDGKFRSVSVRVKDTRMVVTAKKGYWPGN